ncbi:UNVERIFIED_CONTAM: hypothetical protein FKN15_035398 [Acipenser sinensis]
MMNHSMNDSGEQGFYQISTDHVSDRIGSDNETMGWSIQSCRPHCGVYRLQPRANMDSHIKSLFIVIDVRLYQEYLNARASLKISPSPGDDAICQHDAHARCSQDDLNKAHERWESDAPALSTCSNADLFRRMNTMLGNSLDFTGVCTTPLNKGRRDHLPDLQDVDTAVGSRMLFPNTAQESPRVLPDVNDLNLGLQSLSLSGWDQPWSSQDLDSSNQTSTPSRFSSPPPPVLSMLSSPLGNKLGKPMGFPSLDPIGSDFLDKFPGLAPRNTRLESRSLLDSRSSSPVDSETSGFSSSSDHLHDLLSTLRISPPLPFLMSNLQRDALKMGLGSHLDQDNSSLGAISSPSSLSKRWPGTSVWPNWDLLESQDDPFSIEREARLHRQAAAVNEATFTWSGQLPPRNYKNPLYSCKVFLGGVPWDITEAGLINTFSVFGPLSVEWPGKDGKHPRCPPKGNMPKGKLSSKEPFNDSETERKVQVIPWVISDSNFVRCPSQRLDPSKTVFVGALHGMLNAEALASIMNDLFGGVMYAGIDTDKHKYPIGSGRVTFNNQRSYLKAVGAAFVEIKTPKFTKKVQIDPYLEDSMCQVCNRQPGPFFCRDQEHVLPYCSRHEITFCSNQFWDDGAVQRNLDESVGMLQVLLSFLLALAALYGYPEKPSPTDAQSEEPGFHLNGRASDLQPLCITC